MKTAYALFWPAGLNLSVLLIFCVKNIYAMSYNV